MKLLEKEFERPQRQGTYVVCNEKHRFTFLRVGTYVYEH